MISCRASSRKPVRCGRVRSSLAKACASTSFAEALYLLRRYPPGRSPPESWISRAGLVWTSELLLRGGFALFDLLAHLVEHAARNGGVVAELHRELPAARGVGAQIADVTEHLAERNVGFDAHVGRRRLLAVDHAAPAVQIADHIANVCVRDEHVDLHDGFEQLG